RLQERGQRVVTAEAATGGLLAARLSAVEGSVEPFPGGWVPASIEACERLLGVPEETIRTHGLASAPAAEALAKGARRAMETDFGLAITGLTGPGGGSMEKPAGLVFVGLAGETGAESRRYPLPGTPGGVPRSGGAIPLDRLPRGV